MKKIEIISKTKHWKKLFNNQNIKNYTQHEFRGMFAVRSLKGEAFSIDCLPPREGTNGLASHHAGGRARSYLFKLTERKTSATTITQLQAICWLLGLLIGFLGGLRGVRVWNDSILRMFFFSLLFGGKTKLKNCLTYFVINKWSFGVEEGLKPCICFTE